MACFLPVPFLLKFGTNGALKIICGIFIPFLVLCVKTKNKVGGRMSAESHE
jgi:hypothetical protein